MTRLTRFKTSEITVGSDFGNRPGPVWPHSSAWATFFLRERVHSATSKRLPKISELPSSAPHISHVHSSKSCALATPCCVALTSGQTVFDNTRGLSKPFAADMAAAPEVAAQAAPPAPSEPQVRAADGQEELAEGVSALAVNGDAAVPPHRSHDPQFNQKRTDPFQFGSRFLEDGDDPFEFNAWDHVETDDAFKEFAEQQYELQRQSPVSDFDKSK